MHRDRLAVLTLTGLALASSVGITFGLYPAARASKLEPIAALRYE